MIASVFSLLYFTVFPNLYSQNISVHCFIRVFLSFTFLMLLISYQIALIFITSLKKHVTTRISMNLGWCRVRLFRCTEWCEARWSGHWSVQFFVYLQACELIKIWCWLLYLSLVVVYADDVVLISPTPFDMRKLLCIL